MLIIYFGVSPSHRSNTQFLSKINLRIPLSINVSDQLSHNTDSLLILTELVLDRFDTGSLVICVLSEVKTARFPFLFSSYCKRFQVVLFKCIYSLIL